MISKTLLQKANELSTSSQFYSNIYGGSQFNHFDDIKMITKQDLINDQENNPPFGSNLNVDRTQISRLHRTSGTSSVPLLLALTKRDIEKVISAGSRAFQTAGMTAGDIVFNCMNYNMWMGGFMDHQSIEATGAVAVPYGVGRTENLVDMLMKIDRPSLHLTPSYLEIIKDVLAEKRGKLPIDLHIAKGFFGGESGMQNPDFRKKIEDEWGMVAMNANYGLSEAMSVIGSECPEHDGLHFTAEEELYPELYDRNTGIASASYIKEGFIGELVVTNISKEAQPLIRYRTGDVIQIISTDVCRCGRRSFRFNVVGRCDDMIVVKGINFYPESVRPILMSFPQCTGNYTVQIPNTDIVNHITFKIQINKGVDLSFVDKLKKEVNASLFINPTIKFTEEINMDGNKMKIVERVN